MFTPCVDNVPVAERMPKNQKIQASVPVTHNGRFWEYLSKKYARQISIIGTKQDNNIRKSKGKFVTSAIYS